MDDQMTTKKRIALAVAGTVAVLAIVSGAIFGINSYVNSEVEKALAEAQEKYMVDPLEISDKVFPAEIYTSEGYEDFETWWEAVKEKRASFEGVAEQHIEELGDYISEEERQVLRDLETQILNAINLTEIAELETKYNETKTGYDEAREAAIAAELAAAQAKYSGGSSYSYPSGSGVLTRSGGVNYYNGYKETWYSQKVLPGGGLNIPGRHVASDGTVRDGNGYICVASSDLAKGTVVETSLGTGKVYDSGCASGTIDIYTNW